MNATNAIEIDRRVQRYMHALEHVLRLRPRATRTEPLTDAEHQLARQIAESATAYEAALRERQSHALRGVMPGKAAGARPEETARRATTRPAAGTTRRRKARPGGRRAGSGRGAPTAQRAEPAPPA